MQKQYSFRFFVINSFTLLRIIFSPFIFILILNNSLVNSVLAFVLFAFGMLTDAFDGMLARKYNVQSKLGFILDPIADKFLFLFTLFGIIMVEYFFIPFYFFVIIFIRDFVVTILKPVSDYKGFPIPTTFFAKVKTTIQFLGIMLILVYNIFANFFISKLSAQSIVESFGNFAYLPYYVCLVLVVITLVSGLEYIFLFVKGFMSKD